MSLKSAPDLPYDLPPADERKGKTRAESDRHLGNPIVTHRSMLIRYPVGTMAPPRPKNVVGMELGGGPAGLMVRTDLCQHRLTRKDPRHLHRRPLASAARRGNALFVETVRNGPQARFPGRL